MVGVDGVEGMENSSIDEIIGDALAGVGIHSSFVAIVISRLDRLPTLGSDAVSSVNLLLTLVDTFIWGFVALAVECTPSLMR